MKLVFAVALVVMTVGGISAAVIPDSQEMEERAWCDALECQIMDKVIDGLKKIHAGKRMEERAWCDAIECQIMDIVVAALKPILAKFKDIIHDSKKNSYGKGARSLGTCKRSFKAHHQHCWERGKN